jgi:hypothetical protein
MFYICSLQVKKMRQKSKKEEKKVMSVSHFLGSPWYSRYISDGSAPHTRTLAFTGNGPRRTPDINAIGTRGSAEDNLIIVVGCIYDSLLQLHFQDFIHEREKRKRQLQNQHGSTRRKVLYSREAQDSGETS